MNSIEEDIKRIAKLITTKFNNDYSIDNVDKEAIEELLKAYKELKEIEENHRKENGELREQVKELEEDLTSVYLKGIYDERDKWIALVKEKIEELKKLITEAQKELGSASKEYTIYVYQKDILQELLEKRK